MSPPNMSSGGARIYGPRELEDDFYLYKKRHEIEPVLAKIEKIIHGQAAKLDDDDQLDTGGCCCVVGLLDPTANIRVNSVISASAAAAAAAAAGQRIGVGGDDDMAQRSLEGLVTFLTCLFPYLPDAEAVAYLDAADADPLAAALLIVSRLGMRDFGFSSAVTVAAVETALRCAALAARHPDPHLLVLGWSSLSPSLTDIAADLSDPAPDDSTAAARVAHLIQETPNHGDLELHGAWELARRRLAARAAGAAVPTGRELPPVRGAVKRMLLATIHGFYLKALGSLPGDELAERYHRSLLSGGYCYGPLDPVANIVVNTVWYEKTFPRSSHGLFKLAMISTSCLWQVAARSLYGLVSFLCTRYPGLTPDLALQRLLVTGANLQAADPNLFDDTHTPSRDEELDWSDCPRIEPGMSSACIQKLQYSAVQKTAAMTTASEAYAAAATAVFHPSPSALVEFLASPGSVKNLKAVSDELLQCLRDGKQIPGEQFEVLCKRVSSMTQQQREPEDIEINRSFYNLICQRVGRFWGQHHRASRMVSAALENYNKIMGSQYRLHVICGVNELVSGPHFSTDPEVKGYNPWTPHKYHHSHINFLATCLDDPAAAATLFFAECNNHGPDTWCVPVGSWPRPFDEQVRCVYCEHEGDRIVHPAKHGHPEFELSMKKGSNYTNDKSIMSRRDRVEGVEDEEIYYIYRVRPDHDDEEFNGWRKLPQMPCSR